MIEPLGKSRLQLCEGFLDDITRSFAIADDPRGILDEWNLEAPQ